MTGPTSWHQRWHKNSLNNLKATQCEVKISSGFVARKPHRFPQNWAHVKRVFVSIKVNLVAMEQTPNGINVLTVAQAVDGPEISWCSMVRQWWIR